MYIAVNLMCSTAKRLELLCAATAHDCFKCIQLKCRAYYGDPKYVVAKLL